MAQAADAQLKPSLSAVAELLTAAKREVQGEIHDYPAQIAGCDLNFKLLAETRDRLVEALLMLEQLQNRASDREARRALLAHVQSIDGLSDARKDTIARHLV